MHPKVFVKLKKTLKTLSSGQKYPKKKTKKTPKNPFADMIDRLQKTTGIVTSVQGSYDEKVLHILCIKIGIICKKKSSILVSQANIGIHYVIFKICRCLSLYDALAGQI
jgi:hypothetical protein